MQFNGLTLTKVYNVSAKKGTEELCLIALKIDTKIDGKLACVSKNWHEEFGTRALESPPFFSAVKMVERIASFIAELNQNFNDK